MVDLIPRIETIKNTNLLSDDEKQLLLKDLLQDLPLDMFSAAVTNTKKIVTSLINTEASNVSKKKVTPKAKKVVNGTAKKQPLQKRAS